MYYIPWRFVIIRKKKTLVTEYFPTKSVLFIFIILWILLSVFSIWGLPTVPFHPDESTQLFMSSDLEELLKNPSALIWTPDNRYDRKLHYREIDAPLTRYVLDIGRSIFGLSSLQVDWDWSKTWEENRQAGALPEPRLLYIGRLSVTLLLPFSLLLMYLIGVRIDNPTCGLFGVLLLGTNALFLLHGRRAMAEGALVLGFLFALWTFLEGNRHPWLAGLGMALAFNAKYSAIALFPVGFLSIYWSMKFASHRILGIIWVGLQYLLVFLIITLALNPFLWYHPIQALQASWVNRQELLSNQLADTLRLAPEQALLTPSKRTAAMIFNLYVASPAFSEADNYREQTISSERNYLSIPGHGLMRDLVGGGIMLALTLFGFTSALLHFRSYTQNQKRAIGIIIFSTIAQASALLLFIPLPWQRYVIPLVPIICIWEALSISTLLELSRNLVHGKSRFST
jgi:hypothetical protein